MWRISSLLFFLLGKEEATPSAFSLLIQNPLEGEKKSLWAHLLPPILKAYESCETFSKVNAMLHSVTVQKDVPSVAVFIPYRR